MGPSETAPYEDLYSDMYDGLVMSELHTGEDFRDLVVMLVALRINARRAGLKWPEIVEASDNVIRRIFES